MLMDWKLNVNFTSRSYLLLIIFVEEIKILHLVELQIMNILNPERKGLEAYVNWKRGGGFET